MTRLYLIRHGETEWNLTGRWQGHTDVPLNDVGLAQARLLAERMRVEAADATAIYSSDLARAWQTAELIGAALDLRPRPEAAFREIDIGWWGGLTRAEIEERDAATLAQLDEQEDLPRGGAETLRDLYNRASAALEQVVAAHANETVVIVTHGGTIRALLAHAYGNGKTTWPWPYVSVGNTALSLIEKTPAGWHVHFANDMAHLAGAPQAIDVMALSPDDAQQV